ncbi:MULTISPECIES: NAD(P)H-binding protein [Burkholderia]|uniref:NAD(P)H-binding protein n=1 Tax=Burkholderia TaxID=32008 RepID=UPI000757912E|nr:MULTISPECIES: NAD(P)H-binding protein [Burkholderia]KVN53018.1 NAD-dependent dehydratase [Burkholderia anthina]MCA8103565.1 NAD(P)H-binding protein [Burkholderia sp. AU36459]MDF3092207.1 NAD(P)H-binding protein [Burkholderia semiarida]MDF3107739.1 NAD(P)H-binding protein [Burkholderia semiarida]MDF3115366.1 NAD(P)H-binding protein [Burkholderia semiarida]
MKLLLVGATGLVGRHVLEAALADARVDQVIVLARRPLSPHPKMRALEVDFDHLPDAADWWRADAVICTLGTTMRAAGSQAAFRRVDHDYPLAVARLAHRHGTPTYVLNSALGADAASRIFYNRVKGEVEQALAGVGFDSLTYGRPGLIGGSRDEFRFGERLLVFALSAAAPVLPAKWRVNPASRIARALLDAAIDARPGVRVVASDRLV